MDTMLIQSNKLISLEYGMRGRETKSTASLPR